MSVSFSLVMADVPVAVFMQAFQRHVELKPVGEPARMSELAFDADDGIPYIAIGESEGRTYVYDHYSAAISREADLLTDLSADLHATVIGGSADSGTGYYTLVVAADGKLLRYHDNSYSSFDSPYDVGQPLATELLDPLEDIDGVGMRLAVRHLGFEIDAIDAIELTPYELRHLHMLDGPHSEDYAAFLREHMYQNRFEWPKPKIRRADGRVERAPLESRLPRGETGHTPRPQRRPEPTPSWTERLRKKLGR